MNSHPDDDDEEDIGRFKFVIQIFNPLSFSGKSNNNLILLLHFCIIQNLFLQPFTKTQFISDENFATYVYNFLHQDRLAIITVLTFSYCLYQSGIWITLTVDMGFNLKLGPILGND